MRTQTTGQTEVTSDWVANHDPGVNVLATCTIAAPGPNLRRVCTGLTVAFCGGTSAPTAICVNCQLTDADGNVLWVCRFALPATAGSATGAVKSSVWFASKAANKALTLAFNVAGGGATFESVSMEGLTVNA